MSLILDALKKLEREKETPDRGFLVLSHLPWALGRRHSFTAIAVLLLGAGLALGGGLGLWIASRGRAQPVSAAPSAVKPTEPRERAATRPDVEVSAPPLRSPAVLSAAEAKAPGAPRPSPASGGEERPAAASGEANPPVAAASEAAASGRAPGEFRLNAITLQDGRPVALLNDRLVREGDSFDGIRVIRIGEAEVEIEVRGERKLIRF